MVPVWCLLGTCLVPVCLAPPGRHPLQRKQQAAQRRMKSSGSKRSACSDATWRPCTVKMTARSTAPHEKQRQQTHRLLWRNLAAVHCEDKQHAAPCCIQRNGRQRTACSGATWPPSTSKITTRSTAPYFCASSATSSSRPSSTSPGATMLRSSTTVLGVPVSATPCREQIAFAL